MCPVDGRTWDGRAGYERAGDGVFGIGRVGDGRVLLERAWGLVGRSQGSGADTGGPRIEQSPCIYQSCL